MRHFSAQVEVLRRDAVLDHLARHGRDRTGALRLAAIGRLDRPPTRKPPGGARAAVQAGTRRVWIDGSWRDAAVWKREDLAPGQACSGPAIVEEAYTTALVVPGWSVAATAEGHLVATRD